MAGHDTGLDTGTMPAGGRLVDLREIAASAGMSYPDPTEFVEAVRAAAEQAGSPLGHVEVETRAGQALVDANTASALLRAALTRAAEAG